MYAFLDNDEQVKAQVYRHWVNVAPIIGVWLLVGVLLGVGAFLASTNSQTLQRFIPVGSLQFLLAVLFVVNLLLIYGTWWVYRHNYILITNKHIIQVSRHGILQYHVSQSGLGHIQDVTVAQNGVLPNLLGYGNILVETAGDTRNLTFTQIANPHAVADRIMQAHSEALVQNPPQPL